MSYLKVQDAPKPQFISVVVHTEHEQTIGLFLTEQAALQDIKDTWNSTVEYYIARIIHSSE